MLNFIFLNLIITIILLFFIPGNNLHLLRILGLSSVGLVFLSSILVFLDFNPKLCYFQEVISYDLGYNFFNFSFSFGLDGISIYFFLLTTFLFFLCILFLWNEEVFLKEYLICLLAIELLLLLVFSVLDLLLFYIFFEAILIPMFLLIGIWGSRERKLRAAYLLFFYTL